MMTHTTFEEIQKQISKTLSMIVIALLIVGEATLVWSFTLAENAVPWPVFAIVTVVFVFLGYVVLFLKTTVRITEDKIFIKTIPVRTINKDEIEKCEIVDIKALRQFGGWGIRYTWNRIGYISYGNKKGVMLHINGKRDVVISSSKPEELANAINHRL